jgi:hypothetical protein
MQMFDFKMTTEENFATFREQETGRYVFVDSFDNVEFNVRIGAIEESRDLGSVVAESDDVLNRKLSELVAEIH